MSSKVWDAISYPFPNFNFISHYNGCNYLSMPRLKFIHVSKRCPMWHHFDFKVGCFLTLLSSGCLWFHVTFGTELSYKWNNRCYSGHCNICTPIFLAFVPHWSDHPFPQWQELSKNYLSTIPVFILHQCNCISILWYKGFFFPKWD